MSPTGPRTRAGFYPAHDSADEGALNYHFDRPGLRGDVMVEHVPGIRCRIVIEGLVEYVARLHDAMATELAAIQRELAP